MRRTAAEPPKGSSLEATYEESKLRYRGGVACRNGVWKLPTEESKRAEDGLQPLAVPPRLEATYEESKRALSIPSRGSPCPFGSYL